MKIIKISGLVFMLICQLTLGGCWDHLEAQNMLIVAGIGLDSARGGGGEELFHATLEVICVQSSGGDDLESVIVEGKGETIYSALQDAVSVTGGVMYNNHCKVIVIGESLARKDINDVIDYTLRSHGLRKSLEVAIAKDSTAKEILTAKTVKNDIVSYELAKIISLGHKYLNNTSKTGMFQLHEAMISPCRAGVAPAVFIRDNNGEEALLAEGLGVLANGRLVGFLSGKQSNIYNILMKKSKNGHLTFSAGSLSDRPLGAKITRSGVRLIPEISGDTLSLAVCVGATVALESSMTINADVSDPKTEQALQKAMRARLNAEIEALIKETQEKYGADIFGFYKEFEDKFRQEWKTLGQDWARHFKETEFRAQSEVNMINSGLLENYEPDMELL